MPICKPQNLGGLKPRDLPRHCPQPHFFIVRSAGKADISRARSDWTLTVTKSVTKLVVREATNQVWRWTLQGSDPKGGP